MLIHPPIAPWLQRTPTGCDLILLTMQPAQVWLRHLPDNEEELVAMVLDGTEGPDGRLHRYRAFLPWDGGNRVTRYAFKALSGSGQLWLAADGLHPHVPPESAHFRVNPDDTPPEWVREQVFYQVFPDRFARGAQDAVQLPPDIPGQFANEAREWGAEVPPDRPTTVFYGGDLPGIEQRLGYLHDELGATALYLNPVFRSRSNHKYDTEDYFEVDPGFGGNAALQSLCTAARQRGMKLLLDAVVNHTGAQHPWLTEARHRYAFDAQGRAIGWKGHASLPVLDYAHADVREAMFEGDSSVMRRWMKPPYAIDGWRLDAVHMLGEGAGAWNNAAVLAAMRRAVKAENAQAYLVGEHFNEAARWLQGEQEDGAMNYYGFAHPLRAWLAGIDLAGHPVTLTTPEFARWLDTARAAIPYENQLAQLNLLDSHDTPRFLTLLGGDIEAMKLAVTLLMSYPGTPCIYYGDEIGLAGGQDPDCRRCFEWDRRRWNAPLFAHYRDAVHRRQARAELRRGAFVRLKAEGDVYAFARFTADALSVVAVNRGGNAAELALELGSLPIGPSRLEIAVPARGSAVWSSPQ
jgi:alpha-glucosidase